MTQATPIPPLRAPSLVDVTLGNLLNLIIGTEPGVTIPPQDELAKLFGVSRTVVREALSTLEFLNVLKVRPKTGTTVNAPAEWRAVNLDVVEWRIRAGEPKAAVLASSRLLLRN